METGGTRKLCQSPDRAYRLVSIAGVFARALSVIALSFWLFLTSQAQASNTTRSPAADDAPSSDSIVSSFLNQPNRPTVQDALRVRDAIKTDPRIAKAQLDDRTGSILAYAPQLIAQLEAAYPGAIWAPLGRDSAFLADILEAYYLSIGQPERVRRLNASSGSFGGQDLRLDFLKSNGLELGADGLPLRPYILIDATSWAGSLDKAESQIRRLVGSLYEITEPARRRELIPLLNAVGQGGNSSGTQNGPDIDSAAVINDHLERVPVGKAGPNQILYVTEAFSYGDSAWHDTFGRFQQTQDQRVLAPPGPLGDEQVRREILRSLLFTYDLVSSPEFQVRVADQARKLGYDPDWLRRHAHLTDQKRFRAWMERQTWSAETIETFLRSVAAGMPPGFRPILDIRLTSLIHDALEARTLSRENVRPLLTSLVLKGHLRPAGLRAFYKDRAHELGSLLEAWRSSDNERLRTRAQEIVASILERPLSPDELDSIEGLIDASQYRKLMTSSADWSTQLIYFKRALLKSRNLNEFLSLSNYPRNTTSKDQDQTLDQIVIETLGHRWRSEALSRYHELEKRLYQRHSRAELQRQMLEPPSQKSELVSLFRNPNTEILVPEAVVWIERNRDTFAARELRLMVDRAPDFVNQHGLFELALQRAGSFSEFIMLAEVSRRQTTGSQDAELDQTIIRALGNRWPDEVVARYAKLEGLIRSTEQTSSLQRHVLSRAKQPSDLMPLLRNEAIQIHAPELANLIEENQNQLSAQTIRQLVDRTSDFKLRVRLFELALEKSNSLSQFISLAALSRSSTSNAEDVLLDQTIIKALGSRWPDQVRMRYSEVDKVIYRGEMKSALLSGVAKQIETSTQLGTLLWSGAAPIHSSVLVEAIVKHQAEFSAIQIRELMDRASDFPIQIRLLELALQKAKSLHEFISIASVSRRSTTNLQDMSIDEMILATLGNRWPNELRSRYRDVEALLHLEQNTFALQRRVSDEIGQASDLVTLLRDPKVIIRVPDLVSSIETHQNHFSAAQLRQLMDRTNSFPQQLRILRLALLRAESLKRFIEFATISRSSTTNEQDESLDKIIIETLGHRWPTKVRANFPTVEKLIYRIENKAILKNQVEAPPLPALSGADVSTAEATSNGALGSVKAFFRRALAIMNRRSNPTLAPAPPLAAVSAAPSAGPNRARQCADVFTWP